MSTNNLRDRELEQHWNHGFAEGWMARDREVRQRTVSHPRTWWERIGFRKRSGQ